MNIQFNKRKIVESSTFLCFILILVMTFLCILGMADGIFGWNILPHNIENIAILFMLACGLIIGSTFLLSLMINMSIISSSLEAISEKLTTKLEENEPTND